MRTHTKRRTIWCSPRGSPSTAVAASPPASSITGARLKGPAACGNLLPFVHQASLLSSTGRTTALLHQRALRCRLGLSNGLYRITSADKKAREAKIAEAKARIYLPPTVIVKKEDAEGSSLPAAGATGASATVKSEPGSSKASACAATPAIKSEFGEGDVGDLGTPASSRGNDGDDDVADGVVKDEPGPLSGGSAGGAAATQQGGATGGAPAAGLDFGAEDDGGGGAGDYGAVVANVSCYSLV